MLIKSLDDYARDLRQGPPNLRYHAARQLIHYLDRDGAPGILVRALQDADPLLRREACHTLAALGPEACAPLLAALHDPDERVVIAAVRGLSRIGSPEARAALLQALEAPAPAVRAIVGRALGAFPGAETEKRLLARLERAETLAETMGLMTGLVELRSPGVVMPLAALFIFARDRTVRDQSWRLLTSLLGLDADRGDIDDELVLQLVRQCLQCFPEGDRDMKTGYIAAALQKRDIERFCRMLSDIGVTLVVAARIERGDWDETVLERIDRGRPGDLQEVLPPRVWIAVSLLFGLGRMDRNTDAGPVPPAPAEFWLGALALLSIIFELDRPAVGPGEAPSLDLLLDELAMSGRVEPRALIRQVAAFGEAAVPELETFINELESGSAVWWAAKTLGRIGSPAAVAVLTRCLDAGDDALSETAALMLGELGDRALTALLEYVDGARGEDAPGLQAAMTALSMIRRPQALAVLTGRAGSPDPWVRLCVVRHLAHFGDPVAIPVLQRLYADPDQDVRFAAGEALLEMAVIHGLDLPELGEIRSNYYGE